MLALLFDLGGLGAGLLVSTNLGVVLAAPWIIALYPIVLSKRGALTGIYCGRLSTGLHIGSIKPRFRGNTEELWMLRGALIALTYLTGLLVGTTVAVISMYAWGVAPGEAASILSVSLSVSAVSLLVSMLMSEASAYAAYRRGLDPDLVLYPVMSTVADVLVTLIFIAVVSEYLSGPGGRLALDALAACFTAATMYTVYRCRGERVFRETMGESLLSITLASLITNATGYFLKGVSDIIERSRPLYTAYPAVTDTVGDVASIAGSTATTRLAVEGPQGLGGLLRSVAPQALSGWLGSAIMFAAYAATASLLAGAPGEALRVAALLLAVNAVAVPVMTAVSLGIAYAVHRWGWDPDNFVNPLETTLTDAFTTLTLYLLLSLAR